MREAGLANPPLSSVDVGEKSGDGDRLGLGELEAVGDTPIAGRYSSVAGLGREARHVEPGLGLIVLGAAQLS